MPPNATNAPVLVDFEGRKAWIDLARLLATFEARAGRQALDEGRARDRFDWADLRKVGQYLARGNRVGAKRVIVSTPGWIVSNPAHDDGYFKREEYFLVCNGRLFGMRGEETRKHAEEMMLLMASTRRNKDTTIQWESRQVKFKTFTPLPLFEACLREEIAQEQGQEIDASTPTTPGRMGRRTL